MAEKLYLGDSVRENAALLAASHPGRAKSKPLRAGEILLELIRTPLSRTFVNKVLLWCASKLPQFLLVLTCIAFFTSVLRHCVRT